jgi:hypothetical protein
MGKQYGDMIPIPLRSMPADRLKPSLQRHSPHMLTLGRVFHALGLYASTGVSIGRFLGVILTWASMLIRRGGNAGIPAKSD